MKRRDFIVGLGGAAIAPFAARAQQQPIIGWLHGADAKSFAGELAAPLVARAQQSVPTVGVLSSGPPGSLFEAAITEGLKQAGYIDGQNVRLEYRYASGAFGKLPDMMAELLDMRVTVAVSLGTPAARVAKDVMVKAHSSTPLVFSFGSDPVAEGMVASLNRPGGNMTGVTSIAGSLGPKRFELLRQVLGANKPIALLINSQNPLGAAERKDVEGAARNFGQSLDVLIANDDAGIEEAFTLLGQRSDTALIIAVDTLFYGRMKHMAALAVKHAIPAISPLRDFADAGGLMSYGASIYDVNRQAGIYAGRVLKGEKPAEMPVLQPTKFELVINLKGAKRLGLEVLPTLLATADEVIE